jgi:hypothetical protein
MALPNFIIGGAPKAGTTSFFEYLDQHPKVFTSNPKEPHFFASISKNEPVRGYSFSRREYRALFSDAEPEQITGEGSTGYLWHARWVAPKLSECIPDIRLIFLLRDPVDRAYSDFWYRLYTGDIPSWKSFSDCAEESDHWIFHGSHYLNGLKTFYRHFSSEQILVMLTRDLAHEPESTLKCACSHIGVDPKFSFDITKRHNVTRYPRSPLLLRTLGRMLPGLAQWASKMPGLRPIRSRLLFSRQSSKPEMTTEVRARLVDRFEPEILEVSRLIDRDLSDWLQV